ncbi:MAG: Hsp20/alpha crystallin family protein [Halodesulfurarchaeum sp.]
MQSIPAPLDPHPDVPFVDVLESTDAYLVVLDVPGATAETVDITARDRRLDVEAIREKQLPAGFEYRSEDRPVFSETTIPVPPDGDPKAASARVERGVLEIDIPRKGRPDSGDPEAR